MLKIRSRLLATASLSAGMVAAALAPTVTSANPQGGQVVAGSATIAAPSASTVQVNQQSQKSIIDWRSFNIAPSETTQFVQPTASSITLNRVTGGDPSQILGSLKANGQVWLINPDGIVFGKSARVDVAGLLATTLDVTNNDFLAGNYHFSAAGHAPAAVTNAGSITVGNAGLAALVAPGVANSGVIQARLGEIQLASSNGFTLDLYGDGKFNFLLSDQVAQAISGPDGAPIRAAVSNSGSLIADGGTVLVTANAAKAVVDEAIDMSGYIEARAVSTRGGVISLEGGTAETVSVSGVLDASGPGNGSSGGTIKVTAGNVSLAGTARLSASGDAGGGTVLVGGDLHGVGSLLDATDTTVAQGAFISADARSTGSGGRVVVWSNGKTQFAGAISARGGSISGNGGTVEVSSHQLLDYTGSADLRATNGATGNLLLDPEDVLIASWGDTPAPPVSPGTPIALTPSAEDSVISTSTLESDLALANVTVTTGTTGSQHGDITVASSVTWASGSNLTLSAHRNITVEDGVSISATGGGNLVLQADAIGTGVGTVSFQGSGNASVKTGSISIFYNPPNGYALPTDYSSYVSGGTDVAFMLVNNANELAEIETNLNGSYALGKNIDASTLGGFTPMGTPSVPFAGILNGADHTISGLTVSSSSSTVGMFSVMTGTVENLILKHVTVSGGGGYNWYVGGLAGENQGGLIRDVSISGTVSTNPGSFQIVGGLVGFNSGTIANSSSTVAVNVGAGANNNAQYSYGGLVGNNWGTIGQSSSTGPVSGGGGDAGGLAGWNRGTVTQSYSSSPVTALNAAAGGLIGWNQGGSIDNSYASGAVNAGGGAAGGLVELDDLGGAITDSYASSRISQATQEGGLVDRIGYGGGTITNSYWDTQTTGTKVSAGGGTGLTTALLKAQLQTGFDPSLWALNPNRNGGLPSLVTTVSSKSGPSPITVYFTHVSSPPSNATTEQGLTYIAVSQLNTDSSLYGTLSPSAIDPSTGLAIKDETCLAVSYLMLARAVSGSADLTVANFWTSGGATQAGFSKIVGHTVTINHSGPLEGPGANLPKLASRAGNGTLTVLNDLSQGPVLIEGSISYSKGGSESHWMLAIGTATDTNGNAAILAIDPWTGSKVLLSPGTGRIVDIMDPVSGQFYLLADLNNGANGSLSATVLSDFRSFIPKTDIGSYAYTALSSFNAGGANGGFVSTTIS